MTIDIFHTKLLRWPKRDLADGLCLHPTPPPYPPPCPQPPPTTTPSSPWQTLACLQRTGGTECICGADRRHCVRLILCGRLGCGLGSLWTNWYYMLESPSRLCVTAGDTLVSQTGPLFLTEAVSRANALFTTIVHSHHTTSEQQLSPSLLLWERWHYKQGPVVLVCKMSSTSTILRLCFKFYNCSSPHLLRRWRVC